MLTKLNAKIQNFEPSLLENLADLLFEMGRDQSRKGLHLEAVRLFEESRSTLFSTRLEGLSSEAGELVINIKYSLVKSLSHLNGEANRAKAWNILSGLDIELGNTLNILLLRLDLYAADLESPSHEYCEVLKVVIRTIQLTDSSSKTILHHVHKLRLQNACLAHSALETLLTERLKDVDEVDLTEQALIIMIWNCTMSTEFVNASVVSRRVLDFVFDIAGKALSSSAALAAHLVCHSKLLPFLSIMRYTNTLQALMEMYRNKFQESVLQRGRRMVPCLITSSICQFRDLEYW